MAIKNEGTSPISVEVPELSLSVVAWALAVATYGFGDTASTIVLLELGGYEAAWVSRLFLEHGGYVGLAMVKPPVFAFCYLLYRYYPAPFGLDPDPWRLMIPGIMIADGIWLLDNNIRVIFFLLEAA